MKTHLPNSKVGLLRRAAPALAAAVFAAAGCGSAVAQVNVNVDVTIVPSTTTPLPAGTCTTRQGFYICVSKEPVDLTAAPNNVVNTITWNVVSPGWRFDANKGIDIKRKKNWLPKPDPAVPTRWTATNKKDDAIYKYEINVTNGTTPLSWDPTIMN